MRIATNKFLPPKGFTAINLFGIVFVKDSTVLNPATIRHEQIHTAQGKEMLWVFFYLWYVVEWLVRLIQYKDRKEAYYNVSFESEAYDNEGNQSYLTSRGVWSWTKYLNR